MVRPLNLKEKKVKLILSRFINAKFNDRKMPSHCHFDCLVMFTSINDTMIFGKKIIQILNFRTSKSDANEYHLLILIINYVFKTCHTRFQKFR